MIIGYINDSNGCAAWIDDKHDVYSARTGHLIAKERNTNLFSLKGEFIGIHLESGESLFGENDSGAIKSFTELTNKIDHGQG